jgi:hypothetical protein
MMLLSIFVALIVSTASAQFPTYRADIVPLSNSGVNGTAVVFVGADGTTIGYGGFATGLQANLSAINCTALNGCGVHIHSGTSCENMTLQGGHYFAPPNVVVDPWNEERYSSSATGVAFYSDVVRIGTNDVNGRAFIGK